MTPCTPADSLGGVEFDYRLTGVGWASARIRDDRSDATVTASYWTMRSGISCVFGC